MKYILLIIPVLIVGFSSCRTTAEQGSADQLLNEDYRLHNIWALTFMDGREVSREDFPFAIPSMEFNLSKKRFMGNNGCNEFMGDFSTNKEKATIDFYEVSYDRNICKNDDNSNIFMGLITQRQYTYEFGENELIIRDSNKIVLKFRNVD
ncbi:MAG: META domain-containing protein [Bacteroidales bacterium]